MAEARPSGRVLVTLAVIASVAGAAFVACDGTGAYVYYARRYDEPRDCLGPVEALDVFSGTDPGVGCAARCLAVKDPDGGVALYGTTYCGPTPFGAVEEGDSRCAAVRAAVQSTNVCTADAGIKDSGSDAGADAGADTGADAGADTGADAGADTGADAGADTGADASSDATPD